MPRSARAIKLETRTARAKLSARSAPYFLKVAKGLRLGYYRSRNGSGTWIGRRYLGHGAYETAAIGIADDTTAADNVAVFDFFQAQDALRRWGEREGGSPITASCVRAPIRSTRPSRIIWPKSRSRSALQRSRPPAISSRRRCCPSSATSSSSS
jgi:hypothetical protein